MSNDAWGYQFNKSETGTMRAAEIEQREANRRQQKEQDRLAREHQRRMEAEVDRQMRLDRQKKSKAAPKKVQRSQRKQTARPRSRTSSNLNSQFFKIAVVLAIIAGIYASSQHQLKANALWIGVGAFFLAYVGLHALNTILKTAASLAKWALPGIGVIFILYLFATIL